MEPTHEMIAKLAYAMYKRRQEDIEIYQKSIQRLREVTPGDDWTLALHILTIKPNILDTL